MENLSEPLKIIIVLITTGLILFPAIKFYSIYKQKREKRIIDKLAKSFYTMYQNLIVTDFDLLKIESNNFNILDLNFYDSVSSNLTINQFRLIGDFEESYVKKLYPQLLIFTRYMINKDNTIRAMICHLNTAKNSLRSIEYLTEFRDGTVIITSNNHYNSKIEYPNDIEFYYIKTTSFEDLLNHHDNRIQQKQKKMPIEIVTLSNIDGIIEQNKRIKLKENLFRESIKKEDIIKELRRFIVIIRNDKTFSKIADRIIELRTNNDN